MKYESPTIHRPILIETLERECDLIIERLYFVPLGEVACSYIAYAQNGTRYFRKLYTDTRAGRLFSSRLDFYLPLCQQLKKEGVVERLPCAAATVRGKLEVRLASGDTLVLFDFIDGPNVGCEAPMPDELFADGMEKAFADLSAIDQHARPGRIALRQMLEPHADESGVN